MLKTCGFIPAETKWWPTQGKQESRENSGEEVGQTAVSNVHVFSLER